MGRITMNKYYENEEGKLFVDPIVANHAGLTAITKEKFDQIIIDRNTPTPEQAIENQRLALKATRDSALADLTHALADGAVVQVRPADLPNFNMALAIGTARDWVLSDNSVRALTVTEMQEAVADGIAQGEAIWQAYTDGLKAL